MGNVRTLPADVYDTLELSAIAFGGIGAGALERRGVPCCVLGHVSAVTADMDEYVKVHGAVWAALGAIVTRSDGAVQAITRRGKNPRARVTFAEWCKELNVTRGA